MIFYPTLKKAGILLLVVSLQVIGSNLHAQARTNPAIDTLRSPVVMKWTINGTAREALVYLPSNAKHKPVPVVFAFHGHGGTMRNMFNTRRFDQLWPEAIFVCPQGLNTPGLLTDPEGKRAGWAMKNDESNIDLAFFDAMLATLKLDYRIDEKKVFATGHSNGGGFTYLLLATRGDIFAAIAPTATAAGKLGPQLKAKPVLHLMGENDPLVKPIWQKQTYNLMMKLNKCDEVGQKLNDFATFYPSKNGNPVVLFIHPGGHNYPREANESIVEFFKRFGR